MAKIPSKIKIGVYNYTIHYWTRKKADKKKLLGRCCKTDLKIKLQDDLPPDRMAETLLHEVLHAVFDIAQLHEPESGLTEEIVVSHMSPPLLQVLRDNPEFVAYLQNPYPDPVYKDYSIVTAETIGERMLKEAFTATGVPVSIKKADK